MAAGGAIAAWTGSEVFMKKSTFVEPSAWDGGGIFLYESANSTIEASRFSLASAVNSGACVYVRESATLAIRGCHFDGCTASAGGGFYTQPGSVLLITESLVERGYAVSGGALLAYGLTYVANSTFRDSIATSFCGGLFIAGSSASFFGEDLVLRELTSAQFGAAVAGSGFGLPPTLAMRRVAIENCYAESGGSIVVSDSTLDLEEVVIAHSTGLDIIESKVTITRSVIANCTKTLEGGCLEASASTVTIIESDLKGCTAPRGGAVFSASQSRIILRRVIITDSIATEGGGGAALLAGSSVLDADAVTFANCTAADDGGAISIVEDSRVSLGHASILEDNVAAGPGGAVSVRASELYVAPRCSFVVRISVEMTRACLKNAGT